MLNLIHWLDTQTLVNKEILKRFNKEKLDFAPHKYFLEKMFKQKKARLNRAFFK